MFVRVLYLCEEAFVDRDLGGRHPAVETGQGPEGIIKARKHTGDKHTNTSSIAVLILKGNCKFHA